MQATAKPARRIKDVPDNTDHSVHQVTVYSVISVIILIILALLFIFPLYWIITGSFKTQQAVNSAVPVWFPTGDVVTMRQTEEYALVYDLAGFMCPACRALRHRR